MIFKFNIYNTLLNTSLISRPNKEVQRRGNPRRGKKADKKISDSFMKCLGHFAHIFLYKDDWKFLPLNLNQIAVLKLQNLIRSCFVLVGGVKIFDRCLYQQPECLSDQFSTSEQSTGWIFRQHILQLWRVTKYGGC